MGHVADFPACVAAVFLEFGNSVDDLLFVHVALFLAGGMTAIADKRRVQVTRCDKDGKQTKTKVDLVEIGEEGRPDKDMLLKAGDVVWVPMSWY